MEFLAGKGIKPLDKVNGRPVSEITTTNADVVAEIPLALLPELSQQWIGGLELANPYYPALSDAVYHYLARHQAGLPMDGEFLWVLIQVRKGQSFNSLKRFLMDNGSLMRYSGSSSALVPLSLLERLALRPEPERITFVGGPFTTQLINRVRVALTRTPTPTPDRGLSIRIDGTEAAPTYSDLGPGAYPGGGSGYRLLRWRCRHSGRMALHPPGGTRRRSVQSPSL